MNNATIDAIDKQPTEKNSDKASYWSSIIDEWQSSGQSQQIFCQNKRISFAQFGYWRTRLRKIKSSKKSGLVPVKVTAQSGAPGAAIQIRLPTGLQLSIADGCSEQTIKYVLNLMGVAPC